MFRPTRPSSFLLASALLAAGSASAQPAAPVTPVARAASAPERRVIEDDNVRIEETRVRGQVQQITVHNKVGELRPYEIVVGRGGRDPSQDKSAAGQRVWSLLKF